MRGGRGRFEGEHALFSRRRRGRDQPPDPPPYPHTQTHATNPTSSAFKCVVFVIDEVDRDLAGEIEQLGLHCSACPSIMVDLEVAAALARTTIAAVLDGERTR